MDEVTRQSRNFLKDTIRRRIDFSQTDQSRGIAPPPMEKPIPEGAVTIGLPWPADLKTIPSLPLAAAIGHRESRRRYSRQPLDP